MPTENLFDKIRITGQEQDRSIKWYKEKIGSLFNRSTSASSLMSQTTYLQKSITPGDLYLYYYDPKYKDTLPYYDTFPLVFPYALVEGGFMGYNLHYIPPAIRIKLMAALSGYLQSQTQEIKKIKAAYTMLNRAQTASYLQPCIKRYLTSHVRSRFLRIPEDAWISAAALPIERFAKAGKQTVWAQSLSRV